MSDEFVVPRAAASLIVIRRDADAPRMLMGRRGAGHRFMPNVLVFPGGAVDAEDYNAPVAHELRDDVAAKLQRAASAELARALGVAAARELQEEVGVTLGSPPSLHGFDYLCRAITPPNRSMRFDARFFVVDAAHVQGEPVASHEIEEPRWVTIEEALAAELALATVAVLDVLAGWLAAPPEQHQVKLLRDRRWEDD